MILGSMKRQVYRGVERGCNCEPLLMIALIFFVVSGFCSTGEFCLNVSCAIEEFGVQGLDKIESFVHLPFEHAPVLV